jgi:hypothetical protein
MKTPAEMVRAAERKQMAQELEPDRRPAWLERALARSEQLATREGA